MICRFCGTGSMVVTEEDYEVCVNGHILYEKQPEAQRIPKKRRVHVKTEPSWNKPKNKKEPAAPVVRAGPYVTMVNTQYILCLSIRRLAERGYTDRLLEQNAKRVWKAFLSRLPEMHPGDRIFQLKTPGEIHLKIKEIRQEEDEKGNDTEVFASNRLSAVICKDRTVFFTRDRQFFNIDIAFYVLLIALNITQYPVSLVDLYRLIRDGTLPFYCCEIYFPHSHLKEHPFQHDKIRSKSYILGPQTMGRRFKDFFKFLTPKGVPKEFFLAGKVCEGILARLCADFNVASLTGFVCHLFATTTELLHVAGSKRGHPTAAYLAGYVITAIRMVYGVGLEDGIRHSANYKRSSPYSQKRIKKLDDSLTRRLTEDGWSPDPVFVEKDEEDREGEDIFSEFFKGNPWWSKPSWVDKKKFLEELGECMLMLPAKEPAEVFNHKKKKKPTHSLFSPSTARTIKKEPTLFRLICYGSLVTGTPFAVLHSAIYDVERRVLHHAEFHGRST
ncbi:MAG: uncharacterized protein A8A55_2056 [Amphiamblys sp. WSBS2006]|nr:MAG: uncharacterized protein A8A55_2056 [Amphiamblys sp. WSBS2006]